MNERVKKVTTFVKEKWTGFSTAVKIMVCAIPVALIAIIIILAVLLNHKNEVTLFTGLTTAEQGEIAAAISELGVANVSIKSNGDVVVPEDQADYLRMQLAVQGFPKDQSNYDIWNDGVDLWSTDSDKSEVARQQREALIASALTNLDAVRTASVRLALAPTDDYAITQKEEIPTCSVQLQLKDDYELTYSEVRAIYNLVTASVYNLTRDNVTVTDTKMRTYEWVSPEDEAMENSDLSGVNVGRKRLQFQREMQQAIQQDLAASLGTIYGKGHYTVNVSAWLNFDAKKVVDTYYYPVDENNTGVLQHNNKILEYINSDVQGGIVGVTPNADQSPDYPTLDELDDGESFYFSKDEQQYDVSNIITTTEKDGYEVSSLSVGVFIDRDVMTQNERDMVASVVANAVGADIAKVSVYNTVFALSNNGTSIGDGNGGFVTPVDTYRNVMLFVVIALGIILIALIILSLCMSRSRKKKIRRRQEQALAAAQAAAAADVYGGGAEHEMPQEVDFNIASLTEEAGKESRETILKREIADFAKSSPEIVASIIRNMLREEG